MMHQTMRSTPAAGVRVSVASLYASVDVDPDIHIPDRRRSAGLWSRLLRLGRAPRRATA